VVIGQRVKLNPPRHVDRGAKADNDRVLTSVIDVVWSHANVYILSSAVTESIQKQDIAALGSHSHRKIG
jgi:hypothetical protein